MLHLLKHYRWGCTGAILAATTFFEPFFCPTLRAEDRKDALAWVEELKGLHVGDADAEKGTALLKKLNASTSLTTLDALKGMKGANPVAKNWIAGLANTLHRRQPTRTEELTSFFNDEKNDPEARYRALDWLTEGNAAKRSEWLAKLVADSSPEVRFAAIEEQLATAKDVETLQRLLELARHPNQTLIIIAKLKELQVETDQVKHFGFLTKWKLIGPFENTGTKNFDLVFPVESDWIAGKVAESYAGKSEQVAWKEVTTEDREGSVDLAKEFNNEKGCIVYAMTTFHSPIAGPANLRLGSIVGQKAWLNGKLVMKNEVYHAASNIDQYIEPIELQMGPNRILVKLSQNEQKEDWAQRFQFLVRITDETGKAIHESTPTP